MSNSRWARASREDLEALAEATDRSLCDLSPATEDVMLRIHASCPPLRTEAEVAAEVLRLIREYVSGNSPFSHSEVYALAKEPTR